MPGLGERAVRPSTSNGGARDPTTKVKQENSAEDEQDLEKTPLTFSGLSGPPIKSEDGATTFCKNRPLIQVVEERPVTDGGVSRLRDQDKTEPESIDEERLEGSESSEYEQGRSDDKEDEDYREHTPCRDDDESPSEGEPRTDKPKKERKRPAKTAREYWTRKKLEQGKRTSSGHQKRKRRLGDSKSSASPNKATKTQVSKDEDTPLASMAPIVANNQKEQFALIRAQIAEGDTRRTSTQAQDLKQAVKSFGNKKVEAVNGDWRIKPMITPLKSFQITVTCWMCEREVCFQPAGGVLADDMGTGKTLMTLGLITSHKPEECDKERHGSATLIIVPNAGVADQWRREIRTHCGPDFSNWVMIYDPKDEVSSKELRGKMVVITTFHEVGRQYPSKSLIKMFQESHKNDSLAIEQEIEKEKGVLYRTNWYRVVLDEAQFIKGRITQCSLATAELDAKYRWCLSGTPLSNNPDEYFPYLRFIRFPYTEDKNRFNEIYVNDKDALDNFDSMVSLVMIRRRKSDAFLGHKLFEIKERTYEIIHVPLSAEEQIIYRCLTKHYEKAAAENEQIMDNNTHGSTTSVQEGCEEPEAAKQDIKHRPSVGITAAASVSHPFNLENILRSNFALEEIKELRQELAEKGGKQALLTQLTESRNCSSNLANFEMGMNKMKSFNLEAFGGLFKIDAILECVMNETRFRDASCPVCANTPVSPKPTPNCHHVYCSQCLIQELSYPGQMGPICSALDCKESLHLQGPSIRQVPYPTVSGALKEARDKKFEEPGKDLLGTRLCGKNEKNGFFTVAARERNGLPPSAKLTAAMAIILQWQEEQPSDKIIVFTQYIMTAKCLGRMLEQAGIGFLYYYGEVSAAKKKKAITAFKARQDTKVLLVGLRAGGTSLNSTVANRVILIDPWWNDTAEEQAFARVHRIGQEKSTHMVKIFTRSEVDEVIEEMQVDKSAKVAYALQDDGHITTQLTDKQLAKIFVDPRERKQKTAL